MKKIKKKSSSSTKTDVENLVDQVEDDDYLDEDEEEEIGSLNVDVEKLIPTPSVPFNLECSGHYEGAFMLGKIVNLIGDSHAGKTLFALSIFAECAALKRFDNHRFIYDDVESANEFNMPYLFGKKCADRIESEEHGYRSEVFEQFSDNISRELDKGVPFIYILDSADALDTEASIALDAENRKKREAGKEAGGSYGDGKAKLFSAFFKRIKRRLSDNNSALIIISQTRDNIGFGAMFNPKTRSGGKALKFYSFHEIWLAMEKKEKKGDRTYITNVEAKITKNKVNGRHGVARFPILFDYGVDNISSCINFLLREKYWKGDKKSINTEGFYPKGNISYSNLVKWIEDGGYHEDLAKECKKAYDEAIEAMRPKNRLKKYE